MKIFAIFLFNLLIMAYGASVASSVPIELDEFSVYIDGAGDESSSPEGWTDIFGASSLLTGELETLYWLTSILGGSNFEEFFHSVSRGISNGWSHDYGSSTGYNIFSNFPDYSGQIGIDNDLVLGLYNDFDSVFSGSGLSDIDNSDPQGPPDNGFAGWGWDFTWNPGQPPSITLPSLNNSISSEIMNIPIDLVNNGKIYSADSLNSEEGQTPVPEPGTLWLLSLGLVGLTGLWGRRFITDNAPERNPMNQLK